MILNIKYTDHITNNTVKKRIFNHIGRYEELLGIIKRRKLQWYGHITRSNGLSKTILQGTVEGSRPRGRPKKSWTDNIKEWTGMEFAMSQAAAHDRTKWRQIIKQVSKLWCPNDMSNA